MSTDEIKKAIQAGWDGMSDSYQMESSISLDDVHYGPFCPGEKELQIIGDVSGKHVLELACGAAQNSIAFAKWGAEVTAMDFSPRQLQKARGIALQEGVEVNLVQGDMEELSMFRDGQFDVVISSFGWEYVPNLAGCLRECNRVLKPEGMLVICTVHPLTAFEWDEVSQGVLVTDYFNPPVEVWENETGQQAVTFFRGFEEMFSTLTSSGFAVERVVEPCPYAIEELTDSERSALPYAGSYWESQYQRLQKIPFSIVFRARKISCD